MKGMRVVTACAGCKSWLNVNVWWWRLVIHDETTNLYIVLPLSAGNSGGENCEDMCDARWGGKNSGGVERGALLSITGRNPPALQKESNKIKKHL